MESPNLDETRPIPVSTGANETPESNQSETASTQPSSAFIEEQNSPDEAEQTPTLVSHPPGQGMLDNQSLVAEATETTQPVPVMVNATAPLPAAPPSTAAWDVSRQPLSGADAVSPPLRLPCLVAGLAGLIFLVLIALLSAVGGYTSGISLRRQAASTQVAAQLEEQYLLGVQDMALGEYARARQRFEYIINIDPGYPGAMDQLTEALLQLSITATPTLAPEATLTPTPDTRSEQQLFDQAQQAMASKDWTAAIDALLSLRKNDPAYEAVNVDGMLFLALRNRGREKILHSDLEGGIYDLTLARQFGPLDAEAEGLLNWTTMYITGLSFWGIDWEQVVNYLEQVVPNTPNLSDGSGYTATERLRQAFFEFGNLLARQGRYCRAAEQYRRSLQIGPDGRVEQALGQALKSCEGQGQQPTQGARPTKQPRGTPSP